MVNWHVELRQLRVRWGMWWWNVYGERSSYVEMVHWSEKQSESTELSHQNKYINKKRRAPNVRSKRFWKPSGSPVTGIITVGLIRDLSNKISASVHLRWPLGSSVSTNMNKMKTGRESRGSRNLTISTGMRGTRKFASGSPCLQKMRKMNVNSKKRKSNLSKFNLSPRLLSWSGPADPVGRKKP